GDQRGFEIRHFRGKLCSSGGGSRPGEQMKAPAVSRGVRMVAAVLLVGMAPAQARTNAEPEPAKPGEVAIISLDDLKTSVRKHRGRVVVLHFWASWCAPCMEELPLMGQLVGEARAKGVDILSVSLDDPTDRAAELVGRVLREHANDALSKQILRV